MEAYEDYRHVLARVRDELGAWRPAEEFDAALPADGPMNQAARVAGSTDPVAHDGVHPTPSGHRVLAQARAARVTTIA
ncbi:hypothetical protein [Actinacidiphila oryziradicis]|uniref:hypothetical protein n=1 Tax=Actinacidiphila oryziradicis TaxID=2571141 RepID=UPI0023F3EEE8|nr:hypothetical protein [Actinacidiphila oryziradicis]MCW2871433.1 lipolytic protein family [Actinacidiphila oryziradicis]